MNNTVGLSLVADASFNAITGNHIADNKYGIYILESSHNLFYNNNLIDNQRHTNIDSPTDIDDSPQALFFVSEVSINAWDNGAQGNYWSNYTGIDTDSNGIGDTSHSVNSNNIDHYPLMKPIEKVQANPLDNPWQIESFPLSIVALVALVATIAVTIAIIYYRKKRKITIVKFNLLKITNRDPQLLVQGTTTKKQTPTTAETKTRQQTLPAGCCCAKKLYSNNF
jgi:parallel beta-helix repeat protein